ncbi:metallophosphoesterase family protein [Leucobacter zeae]|nr:metallophosphoesterase family protein [Leucobacter zeae]
MRRGAVALAVAALLGSAIAPTAALAAPEAAANAVDVPKSSLVTAGTTWHYLDDNTDPAGGAEELRAWTAPAFDDDAWKSAPGGFGVKNNKLAPVGSFTPATKLEHYIDGQAAPTIPTYFFRTSFDLEAGVAERVASLSSTVSYDDALVVWINGEHVASYEDARITGTKNLEYAGSGNGSPVTSTFSADGDLLRDGENTIAVALYQDRETSSDAYFEMSSLTLTEAAAPGEVVVAAPTRVILTPTEEPETSQSFSWLAGDASHDRGQVEIRPAAGGETVAVDAASTGTVNGNPKQHYSATVRDLAPATAYRYRVGLPGSWSEWFEFRTADPDAKDFQFVYYGDAQIGLDTTWPKVVEQAEARATESIGSVHAGDLINTGSNDTEWTNWFTGMERSATRTNVMAAPGNHEYSGDKLLASWKAHFEYPLNQPSTESIGDLAGRAQGDSPEAKQYAAYFAHWADFAAETVYYADYQGVRFITLNATRDTTFLTPAGLPACSGAECPSTKVQELWTEYQAAWLDYVLAQSASKWNVVTFHQPVYSTSSGRDEPVLRKYWVPVFEKHNIDLVLMGHDHTYARGTNNDDTTATPGLTTGPVYAVSNSGAKHYDLASEADNVWTNNGATQMLRGENVTTYQVIDVSEDRLVYRSYLAEKPSGAVSYELVPGAAGERPAYRERAVPNVGDLFDEVTVTKYASGEKWVTEQGVEAPAAPKLSLDAASVSQGGSVTLTGAGFAAGAEISLELRSEPVPLGEVVADEHGAFSRDIGIPRETEPGEHRVVAVLPNGGEVSAALTVTAAAGAEAEADGNADGAEGGTDSGAAADGGADAGASGGADVSGGADAGGRADGATANGATDGANATAATGGSGSSGSGSAKGSPAEGLATTGGSAVLPIALGGAALLGAGALLLLARRRRAAAHRAE